MGLSGYVMFFFQVAVPNVVDATKDADILIFVLPHQFVRQTCKIMQEHVKDTAIAISLIKVRQTFTPVKYLKTGTHKMKQSRFAVH